MTLKNLTLWLTTLALLFLISGCATMNASECKNADWEMIGFEDGGEGRLPTYLGDHRQACAEYNITPDMNAYLRGHANGVRQFCTELNGFALGEKGLGYNGVCPPELEGLFLSGYRVGQEFYDLSRIMDKLESNIKSDRNKKRRWKDKIEEMEDRLVQGKNSKIERKNLLDEIREYQRKIGHLEQKIKYSERDIAVKQYEYEQLSLKYDRY